MRLPTPPAGSIDPRRPGIRSNGSYWGGGGEQIDLLSGNLNFALPLLQAQGRTGWTVPVGLAYNSQNWRQDNSVNWQLAGDLGYGFGWKLAIGSITPYYTGWTNGVDHYVYTDSSGAEYLLNVNSGGVWSSSQGVYVWFDTTQGNHKLHFKDGSFWQMGCTSGGNEFDAGTMYPTIAEDTYGNQVLVAYEAGAGLASTAINSSSRIATIEDVRGNGSADYTFTYNTDSPVPHLTGIANSIGTAETYTLTYASSSLGPPFGTDPTYSGLTTTLLAGMTVPTANAWQFGYDSAGAGELLSAISPYGGELSWNYASFAYIGSRSLREVSARYVAADSAHATQWTYGVGSKTWSFLNASGTPAWEMGLLSELVEKPSPSSSTIFRDTTSTWSQDPAGNSYISTTVKVIDEGTSNQQTAKTTMTLDQYGNVTQSVIYPYNNTSTPLNTYSTFNYSRTSYSYGYNLLASTVLTTGGTNKTLVTNYYGSTTAPSCSSTSTGPGTPTYEFDTSQAYYAVPWISGSVTPVKTSCQQYYSWGLPWISSDTTGQSTTITANATTNYAAPGTVTTQIYSQNVSYNSWLGMRRRRQGPTASS
jgi:hypothetical protein